MSRELRRSSEMTKFVVIVGDGMADYAVEDLDGKTPLMVARTPHMDWLAKHGEIGLVRTVPEEFAPGLPAPAGKDRRPVRKNIEP